MTAQHEPTPEVTAYLVVVERGGLFGAYLDSDFADRIARDVEGVLVAVPSIADYRTASGES